MEQMVQVVDQKADCKWDTKNKCPGERIGTAYTILKYKRSGPVLVKVKIADLNEAITSEEIRQNSKNRITTWATFEGYEEEAYIHNEAVCYTATADAIKIDLDGPGLSLDGDF